MSIEIIETRNGRGQRYLSELAGFGYVTRVIDGHLLQDAKSAVAIIGSALSFPEHCVLNVNAFRDCLADLAWLKSDKIALGIEHADHIPVQDSQLNLEWLPEAFFDADEYLMDPLMNIDFRVLLFCEKGGKESVLLSWKGYVEGVASVD